MSYLCTPAHPWTPDKGTPVQHSSVEEIGQQDDGHPGGDIVTMRCRNCGHTWKQELPQ